MSKYVSGNIAFALLFLGAALFRLMAFYLISRMQDLPMHSDPQHHFTFWMFIRRFRESNFVKYIGYVSSVTFATQLALPYLNVHMLENLGFSYLEYTLIHVTGMFSALVGYPVWGKHADHIGNAHVLKLISFILPVFPLMWIFAKTPLAFIGIELISGFMWGGFNLCSINFIYDACSAPKRVRCLSYFNLINGGAIFAGASLGGYLMENLPALYGYPVIGLFILSAFFRLMAHFCLSKTFEEVRVVRHLPSSMNLFASIIGVRPLFGRQDITEENEY